MPDAHPPFPFIVGCPRSGTTLLRGMLDSHPEMAVPPESHLLVKLVESRGDFEKESGFACAPFLERILSSERLAAWKLDAGELRRAFAAAPPRDLAGAVRLLYQGYARARGKRRHGDKTPRYVSHLPELAALLPEACFLHIIRDGRDVALSLLDSEWGPRSVEEAAAHWAERVSKARADGAALGAARYLEVIYERLVAEPEAVLAGVATFCGLDFRPEMLRYHERADELRDGFKFPHRHGRLSLAPTQGLRDWRVQMSPADVRRFLAVAGELLADLGYPAN